MRFYFAILIGMALLVSGCGSSKELQSLSAEERFELGKSKFNSENYLEAIEEFKVITLQFPGSSIADSAQFLLAESYFHRSQYILAASEFENLVRTMPSSKLVSSARYQIGMCYYELSPPSELDQKYTLKALDAFQTFLEYHPTSSQVPDAEQKIQELNSKLAKKEYDSGVIYMRMEKYKAAERQFDFVSEKYHDTEYADRAYIGKIEALVARNRYPDARKEVEKFLDKYPTSPLKGRAESLKEQIEGVLEGRRDSKAQGASGNEKTSSKSQLR